MAIKFLSLNLLDKIDYIYPLKNRKNLKKNLKNRYLNILTKEISKIVKLPRKRFHFKKPQKKNILFIADVFDVNSRENILNFRKLANRKNRVYVLSLKDN
jgi:hypothetical protein